MCQTPCKISCSQYLGTHTSRTHGRTHARTNRTKPLCFRPHYVGRRHKNASQVQPLTKFKLSVCLKFPFLSYIVQKKRKTVRWDDICVMWCTEGIIINPSTNRQQLLVPRCRLDIVRTRRAFFIAGPTVWNSLPDELRDPTRGSDSFKQFLKTILFSFY